jgi:GntR family transcriptional regulator, rspAB operon transcriptional repressor
MTQSRKVLAYEAIKQKIIRGELTEGQPISEKEITDELGISRTPLREALSMLEQEHLLEIHPKRGVFISRVTYKDINNIYSIRLILEPFAVRQAGPSLRREDLLEQQRIWSEAPEHDTPVAHIERDTNLHNLITEATDNKYLMQFLKRLYDQARRIRFLSVRRNEDRQYEIGREHRAIIDGLLDGDLDGAEMAMRAHLERARETALKVFSV